jgi:hypothetical protein
MLVRNRIGPLSHLCRSERIICSPRLFLMALRHLNPLMPRSSYPRANSPIFGDFPFVLTQIQICGLGTLPEGAKILTLSCFRQTEIRGDKRPGPEKAPVLQATSKFAPPARRSSGAHADVELQETHDSSPSFHIHHQPNALCRSHTDERFQVPID